MARLTGPDEGSRLVYVTTGTDRGKALAAGFPVVVYSDSAGTLLADIQTTGGATISGSALTVDDYSMIPLFKFPDGVDTVYVKVNGGPATAVYARTDDRLDSVATDLATEATARAAGALGRALASFTSRAVPLGDSITFGSDNPSNNNSRGLSWPMFAEALSDGKFHYVRNAGVSGNTSAQMLARFDTDVTPYTPTMVTVMAGRNDISGSVSLATFQANIAAIIAKIRAINAMPWLFTITPASGASAQTTRLWNAWLRAYAATNSIPLTDAYEATVDPATGGYLTAYNSGDNVHPSEAGYYAIGSRFATDLGNHIATPRMIPRLADAADTNNIMAGSNPLWLTNSINANQEPSGWNIVNPTSVTGSMITNDTTIAGNWYRMTFSSSAADVTLYRSGAFATTVGRKYALTGLINSQLSASNAAGSVHVQVGTGAGTSYAVSGGKTTSYRGRFWVAFTSAATTCNPQVFVKSGATGTVDVAEFAVFDLTTMGIDSLVSA